MPINENYDVRMDAALQGMVADLTPATIISRTVETAALGFGKAVVQGSTDDRVRESASGDLVVLGISVRSQSISAESPNEYPINDTAGILVHGAIWVTAGAAVNTGDPVHITVDGSVFDTGAGAGKVELVGGRYETSGGIGDLVRIRII